MKYIILTLALAFASLTNAQETYKADPQNPPLSPVEVVESQLDAFATGNWELAYGYAAPQIKAMFPNPEIFELMVVNGYAYMLEPLDAAVSLIEVREDQALVEAVFVSDKTAVDRVGYMLVRGIDQHWRISGVFPFPEKDSAV